MGIIERNILGWQDGPPTNGGGGLSAVATIESDGDLNLDGNIDAADLGLLWPATSSGCSDPATWSDRFFVALGLRFSAGALIFLALAISRFVR